MRFDFITVSGFDDQSKEQWMSIICAANGLFLYKSENEVIMRMIFSRKPYFVRYSDNIILAVMSLFFSSSRTSLLTMIDNTSVT